jgi:hypothetical protein
MFATAPAGARPPAPAIRFAIDSAVSGAARHGLDALSDALRHRGFQVVEAPNARADFTIGAGLCTHGAPESLTIRHMRSNGHPALQLCGSDARGLMYAALETAERVSWGSKPDDPFEFVKDTSETPFLSERGVSMYTMQRAYFESRLFDEKYWTRYFDMLAADRINSFVVIFGYENGGFMAPLYPYFFDVDEFPDVQLVGLSKDQQQRNTAAFKTMMRIAHERGISVTAGIWDHIYRGGVQAGGIPGAPKDADQRTPGLVWGVTTENLAPYTKAALRKFLKVFPEVDAIQFRMHEESGLKSNEIVAFWHEVFGLIKQARPDMKLDLRAKGLPDAVIDDAIDQGLQARVSTKFWMEQMGLPFHPTHINPPDQKNRRHSYADLLRYPQRYRVHWQVWSGGTTRLLLWGDPDYVRRFAQAARLYDGNSFEVNEMLATKMLGEPHDEKPIDILNPKYRYYDYEFERYWHFYQVWGRLTYDPHASDDIWQHEFDRRFGAAGPHLMNAEHLASQVLPHIVAAAYRYSNFPTTRGWAEMMRQGDLPQFATLEGTDTAQFMSPRDDARAVLDRTPTALRRPEQTAEWFAQTARSIARELEDAESAASDNRGNEFHSTVTDLRILAALARFYSERLLAAVDYNVYKNGSGGPAAAVFHEDRAVAAWSDIVKAAGDVYSEKLPFGAPGIFPRHWREELARLETGLAKLKQDAQVTGVQTELMERVRVPPAPPTFTLAAAGPATPGHGLRVTARAVSTTDVQSVRLRYRHVTQFEDYQTAAMTLDAATNTYTGSIPASFIDPKWDLMYYVEVLTRDGGGRIFPDLDVETPYAVVPIRRATQK